MGHKCADVEWDITNSEGKAASWATVPVAVLMDIRTELKSLNRLLHCQNFQQVPATLRGIRANTSKPKKRKEKP